MAYDFNGTTQYLYTTSVPTSSLPLSICAWFYADSLNGYHSLVNLSSGTSGATFALDARGGDVGDPVAASDFRGGVFNAARTTAGYVTGQWQHGAAVFAANNSRTAYLDGGNSATNTANNTAKPTFNRIGIGIYFNASNVAQSYLNGRLAEVGIWNAALTAAEVASLAKGITCDKIRPQNLVFYAPLVRDLIDAKGGLVLTNNNGATVAAHPRIYP